MKQNQVIALALLAGLVLAAGYWWGRSSGTGGHEPAAAEPQRRELACQLGLSCVAHRSSM